MANTPLLLLPLVAEGDAEKEVKVSTALGYLENFLANSLSLSVAGNSDVTLTEAQNRAVFFEFTGTLTGSINVIFPPRKRVVIAKNSTGGGPTNTLSVKTVSGTPYELPSGTVITLICDGEDFFLVSSSSGSLADGDYGDISIASGVWSIDSGVVSNAKLANMAEARVKGRIVGSGTGAPVDLTGTELTAIVDTFGGDAGSGGTRGLVPAPAAGDGAANKFLHADGSWTAVAAGVSDGDYGDITVSSSGTIWTIDNSVISNAKLSNMAEATVKGRVAGSGTGAPVDLTTTELTALLNNFVGDSGSGGTKGAVPAPASGDAAANKFLKADGTWTAPTASLSGGAANKVAFWTDSTTLSNDASLHWDSMNDVLGIIATAGGTSGVGLIALGLGTVPTTGPTDVVQLFAIDEAAGKTGLGITAEGNIKHLFSTQSILGSHTRSTNATAGLVIDQKTSSDAILQFRSTGGGVAHGMTSLVATDIWADFRLASSTQGGIQARAFTEATLAWLVSAAYTTSVTTMAASTDAPVMIEVGKKSGSTIGDTDANDVLFGIAGRFGANPTVWLANRAGATWQPGEMTAGSLAMIGSAGANPTTSGKMAFDTTKQSVVWAQNSTKVVGSAILSLQSSGNTNDSSSGSGADFDHTLTYSIPANMLNHVGRMLRVTQIWLVTTGSAPPTLLHKLKFGSTAIFSNTASTPATNLSARTYSLEFNIIVSTAGASGEVICSANKGPNADSLSNSSMNNVSQPVGTFATTGAITLTHTTQWGSAGTGTNTIQLLAAIVEVLN